MNPEKTAYPSTRGILLGAAAILSIPVVAMLVTGEFGWGPGDFVFAAAILLVPAFLYQRAAMKSGSLAYRAGVGLALLSGMLLIWINLAVGIIGSEDHSANGMYIGVLAVGLVGAAIARLQPEGMARTMFAMAIAQALVAAIAIVGGLGGAASGAVELLGVNGIFVALYVGSALLFREAAQRASGRGTA